MLGNDKAHGVLFYATIYTSVILAAVAILTGRVVFAVLIGLTLAMSAFLMYSIQNDVLNLESTGKWFQNTVVTTLEKLKHVQSMITSKSIQVGKVAGS